MRYKVAPEPCDEELLFAVRDALPLVPGSVDDCCTRIHDRTDLPSRDAAREWLTFVRALGLAAKTTQGYHRVRNEPEPETLAVPFVEHVFLIREIVTGLEEADEPIPVAAIFEDVRDEVPRWERQRYANWEEEWRNRIATLLEWAAIFDIVDRAEDEKAGEYSYTIPERAPDFS